MYLALRILFLPVMSTISFASIQLPTCPDLCTCSGTSAKCRDVTDANLPVLLAQLPQDLTQLDLSQNNLTLLKKGTFKRLGRLEIIELRNNGKHFAIHDEVFHDTTLLTKLRIEGNPKIRTLRFLKPLKNLREISADSWKSCKACNYTRISNSEHCRSPRFCVDARESPFGGSYCACVMCTRLRSEMNCTNELPLPPRILGEQTAIRVVLWGISTLALISNLALIATRVYTHSRRQRPLNIFVVGLALSNLFVTSSTIILLVADRHETKVLGQGSWSQSVCSPAYFLQHFGIYSLMIILTFLTLERFARLGYKLCFPRELSFRRSILYLCEAWVLSFLLIIPPWTRVTTWHKFCAASYEMLFAKTMYVICGLLVLGVCFTLLVLVGLLFWRRVPMRNTGRSTGEIRTDIRLILAGVLTFVLIGMPHGSITINRMYVRESGAEIVTILLALACPFYPVIFMNYSPNTVCLSDTLSTKNMECVCGKCKTEQLYPAMYSLDSLNPPKSPDTIRGECNEPDHYNEQGEQFMKALNAETMAANNLLELDDWTSRCTKTKSWIESCDYEDLRKLRAHACTQTGKRDNGCQVTTKPSTLTESERYGGKSTSTSGVNDVSSMTSSCTCYERASLSSDRARMSSGREQSFSDHASSGPGYFTKREEIQPKRSEHELESHEIERTGHEITSIDDEIAQVTPYSGNGRTSHRKTRSKLRLTQFRGFIQRALSPKRQRSKSLPEKTEECIKQQRSQSVPYPATQITPAMKGDVFASKISLESSEPSMVFSCQKSGENTYKDRLPSFVILPPMKSPKRSQKPLLSEPGKAKPVGIVSPTPSQKSSMAERFTKNFSLARKLPSREPKSPTKIFSLEEGDVLTALPVMRRQKGKTNRRDVTARVSTGSTGSTGSITNRFSLEWDPIGSMEGYDEREVLPPDPPIKTHDSRAPAKLSRPLSEIRTFDTLKVAERTSLYSLDWDPTSVQLRNSVVSRDSLTSLEECVGNEGRLYDIEDCNGSKGKSVWV